METRPKKTFPTKSAYLCEPWESLRAIARSLSLLQRRLNFRRWGICFLAFFDYLQSLNSSMGFDRWILGLPFSLLHFYKMIDGRWKDCYREKGENNEGSQSDQDLEETTSTALSGKHDAAGKPSETRDDEDQLHHQSAPETVPTNGSDLGLWFSIS